MGSAEKFCLRWNDFESNISKAFSEIRDDKDFFDVTLACEGEQILDPIYFGIQYVQTQFVL